MRWGNTIYRSKSLSAAGLGLAAMLLCGFSEPAAPVILEADFTVAFGDEVFAADDSDAAVQDFVLGRASYYADKFNGRRTANGEIFNQQAMTAAHRSLPMGSMVRVTSEKTGRSVTVRVNDRGPFTGNRLIDVSKAAARELGMIDAGIADVRMEVLTAI